ncbi:MAG: 30S ribosomal protein S9 [Phycisphaerae bacterium]|nr:30S ribosomal protein S9 [Phycisphaerae bacterium]
MTEKSANSPLADLKLGTDASPIPSPTVQKIEPKCGFHWGTGRRKTSVARVRIKPGSGTFKVNRKDMKEYFTRPQDIGNVIAPLKATDTLASLDVFVNVKGGGITGQSGAIMLGIARALKNYDPSLAQKLRDGGLLTRDGRMVERKKPGRAGARKRFQFSKR